MTHTLVRDGTREFITPVAYVPFRAPYTYWETRVGWKPVYPTPGAVWGYDPATGQVNAFESPAPWLERFTYSVPITIPGQAEVKEVTGGWLETPPSGWTAYAYSHKKLPGSGNATFKVPAWVRGVAIGLTATPTATGGGYGHIPHGLLFQEGRVYNLRTGADYGENSPGFTDVWGVTATGTDVVLKKNGSTLATEATTLPNAPLSLAATMFSAGDTVDNPEMDATFSGTAAMTMGLGIFAWASAHAEALMTLPPVTLQAESFNVPEIRLAMFGAESIDGYAAMLFPTITMEASAAPLPPQPPTAFLPMQPLILTAYMLTGEIAEADMVLPPLSMLGYDYAYAGAFMTLPPITMSAYDEPANEAYAFSTAGVSNPASAGTVVLALMLDGVMVASAAAPQVLIDAIALSTAGVLSTAITSQVLDAIAMSFVNVGAAGLVPGLGSDTWVWNADSKGSTSYSGYGFNSFARIGDRYYGASEDGLFELDGDTDAGAPIRAVISPGKLGFGTSAKKTVVDCYVGMSGEGYLVLKVIAEGQSYLYRTRSFSEEMQQQKIDLGLGLRTNYVTLELFNENGQDFEVDTLEFLVADLSRRIGG